VRIFSDSSETVEGYEDYGEMLPPAALDEARMRQSNKEEISRRVGAMCDVCRVRGLRLEREEQNQMWQREDLVDEYGRPQVNLVLVSYVLAYDILNAET